VKFETVSVLSKIEVRTQDEVDREEEERRLRLMRALQAQHAEAQSLLSAEGAGEPQPASASSGEPVPLSRAGVLPMPPPAQPSEAQGTFVRGERKIGRNEPCPCGSGKKYKNCHGALSGLG